LALADETSAVDPDTMTTDRLGMTVLSADECFELMRGEQVGRLAVTIGAHPDIFPINYVVDGEAIVFRTLEGTKLAAAVLTPAVAFEVDGVVEATDEAWSVVVKGRAREIEGIAELLEALDLPLYPWQAAPKHRFVRIVPNEVSGRRFVAVDPSVWTA
jgi:nitroimidazol reductase NimA-like FMN-containing flavoprotein (pyridoxamine 5'-phosphate oxidase superfamily)